MAPSKVVVWWSPAAELVASFAAFAQRKDHKMLDLGPEWLRSVRQQVTPAFVREAVQLFESEVGKQFHDLLAPLLRAAPPTAHEPEAFLDWAASLAVGNLYERIVPLVPEGRVATLPRDLGSARDRHVRLLRTWHEAYFRGVDPELLVGLAAERDAMAARVGTMPDGDLVELATNGIRLEPPLDGFGVVLVPQYHDRPYNEHIHLHELTVFLYPADVLPTPPGEPPASLRRLTAALADPSRLRILRYLATGTRSLTEVAREIGLAQSTVHHHLVALRAAGLTRTHYGAGANRYSLRPGALDAVGAELRAFLNVA